MCSPSFDISILPYSISNVNPKNAYEVKKMYNDHNILIFDYKFNYDIIESYWDNHEDNFAGYTDPRIDGDWDHWQIARLEMFDYA